MLVSGREISAFSFEDGGFQKTDFGTGDSMFFNFRIQISGRQKWDFHFKIQIFAFLFRDI